MASVTLDYAYDVDHEVSALETARKDARVPRRKAGRVLVASWNIARLGANERRDEDYQLLATMIGWFELVALQEVRDNLAGLRAVQDNLPKHYRVLFSDSAGNYERMAFVYDSRKVSPLEEIGEIGFSPRELAAVRAEKVGKSFVSFDRTPHLAAFEAESAHFLLANVHLYYGTATELKRRAAEAFAVASWAERRQGERHTYTKNVLALGDFNLPRADPTDAIYRALVAKGLRVPKDVATRIGTNLGGAKQYDQVVFLPEAEALLRESGVVRFDDVLFQDVSDGKRRQLLRYRISDHRILWFSLATDGADERAATRAGPPAEGELVRPV
jgi:endonuclease/exonuclease/phosphatase family metal-dependent hydrolase